MQKLKLLIFTVIVNPFTKTAIVKCKVKKNEYEIVELTYKDIDEWQGFEICGRTFDIHFCYDEEFTVSIYDVINNETQTDYWHKVNLKIKLNDLEKD